MEVNVGVDVYLDYNASTPLEASVLEAMLPWFRTSYANPSSQHGMGRAASDAIRSARESLAGVLDVGPSELVFTSGATEANNLALRGLDPELLRERPRIVTLETEHPSVLEPLRYAAEQRGLKLDVLPVERSGLLDLERLEASLGPDVALVSTMVLNNETGVIQPIERIAELAHGCGALLHSDTAQALGRLPLNLADLGVDLATLSAHKSYGPKGAGCLYIRRGVRLVSRLRGGGQESGIRSGTENVPAIVGFAAAADWVTSDLESEGRRIEGLRSRLLGELRTNMKDVEPIAPDCPPKASQSPWTLSVRFCGADAEAVIANAPALAISSGSACSSGSPEPSHVFMAMLGETEAASECLRISFGRPTTVDDIHFAAAMLRDSVEYVRSLS